MHRAFQALEKLANAVGLCLEHCLHHKATLYIADVCNCGCLIDIKSYILLIVHRALLPVCSGFFSTENLHQRGAPFHITWVRDVMAYKRGAQLKTLGQLLIPTS